MKFCVRTAKLQCWCTNKTTPNEDFDAVHKEVLDGISDNMASLVQLCKYGAIYESDPTTMGYYLIK